MKKMTDAPFVNSVADDNSIFGNFGNSFGQIKVGDLVKSLNVNDDLVLNQFAFYIDVNKASSKESTCVDTGGNMNMRQLWEDAAYSVIMDANGNYCKLNRNDNRYTEDGQYILDESGNLKSDFAHGDLMKIIPKTYGRVQVVDLGGTTVERLWLSLVPLPGGYEIPQLVVGKFKCSVVDGKMRSLPNKVPTVMKTIYQFWQTAQVRSKNHGLANLDFRNYLLFYMMSKYGWRDSQNCKTSDGSLVWGVGLDGTENTTGSSLSRVERQKNIATGATLILGENDGNSVVTDAASGTCHSVNVGGFENPWGQYWEMVGGLASIGTDVYCWRSNFMPSTAPTAATFDGVDYVLLTRPTTALWGMNIISSNKGQGVYMIPKQQLSGVSYGDNFINEGTGALFAFGGSMDNMADCGLACVVMSLAWTYTSAYYPSRLAYYGETTQVSTSRFIELGA